MELGDYERDLEISGQELHRFENCYYFPLEKGVFYKAGNKHWPSFLNEGYDSKGISINYEIMNSIPAKGLFVHDKNEDKFYMLDDLEQAMLMYGKEERNGVNLIVIPLDVFEEVEIEDRSNLVEVL